MNRWHRLGAVSALAAVVLAGFAAAPNPVAARAIAPEQVGAPASASQAESRASQVMFNGPDRINGKKAIYLTFDDGPDAGGGTSAVLRALKRSGIRATFFVVGYLSRTESGRRLLRDELRAGMPIALHSMRHANMSGWSTSGVLGDLRENQRVVKRATKLEATCFRPPGGSYGQGVLAATRQLNMRVALWDIDPRDWTNPGSAAVADRVISHLRPGGIAVMHDGAGHGYQAAAAIPRIVSAARARGYVFGTLCPMR